MFGELGQNIPEGMIPNDYDTQAYLMDLKTRDVTPISREFAPSIQSAIWHKQSGDIIFKAVDGEYERLFRFSPDAGSYQQLNSGIDVVNAVDIADNGTVAAYYGSSASMPHKAYILDLKGNQNRLLADPSKSDFQHVRFGKVDRWLFQNEHQGLR
ncbi:MAG: SMP-30/gluconolactonase/LRE family protein [candidate division Zixibacteria bacterium]|nr:SMP-30/gluconolactonase/LRE family protein [candidate division Zixibacteria bacterium]NIX58902.1 hypothetical protein [candidate division Zixibacteria bacterium]